MGAQGDDGGDRPSIKSINIPAIELCKRASASAIAQGTLEVVTRVWRTRVPVYARLCQVGGAI
jgi:hypothetical protein